MNTNTTMPEASSTTLRMAVEAARNAAKAAAHTAAIILIEANGGQGRISHAWRGEDPIDSWCVVTSEKLTVHFFADSYGDRVHLKLTGITPAAYEQMRTWAEDRDDCNHDHNCACKSDPWPTLAYLTRQGERRIDYRDGDGGERGHAALTFKRVTLTLFDEPVTLVDTLLRIARSAA
ncbi:hypothetical protein [Streptomyces sp. NPDC058548]|uniref:hypothetical protein n=1 Tax=Streptomyces sp. NPDC058548 TaxID=3346545 RepID=UPI00365FB59A